MKSLKKRCKYGEGFIMGEDCRPSWFTRKQVESFATKLARHETRQQCGKFAPVWRATVWEGPDYYRITLASQEEQL